MTYKKNRNNLKTSWCFSNGKHQILVSGFLVPIIGFFIFLLVENSHEFFLDFSNFNFDYLLDCWRGILVTECKGSEISPELAEKLIADKKELEKALRMPIYGGFNTPEEAIECLKKNGYDDGQINWILFRNEVKMCVVAYFGFGLLLFLLGKQKF
jgi:hypothetical protein